MCVSAGLGPGANEVVGDRAGRWCKRRRMCLGEHRQHFAALKPAPILEFGEVEIELKHIFNKEHFDKSETTSLIKERWVFENGGWYRWPMDS